MPSPGVENPIKILIHGTAWLEPIEVPIIIPPNIPVGSIVTVPGELRCLIRSETATRPMGNSLYSKDTVRLIASFDRLERAIPELSGEASIEIKYPLLLEAPKCLASIAKGDVVRFHWTVSSATAISNMG